MCSFIVKIVNQLSCDTDLTLWRPIVPHGYVQL